MTRIEWTEPALADLEGIRDYISKDSSFYATRFIERIFDHVDKLLSRTLLRRHTEDPN
ncbi:MAG: type II toxin-antitoxin system RelE/ParE family toxin [Pseudomonadota bacterium]|nr:type II toxin-antitoxin system RelE/ParE family toxin [Pseudomonadota bacterium]